MTEPIVTCCQQPTGDAQTCIAHLARSAIQFMEWQALSRAMTMAIRAHAGQRDKAGAAYVWHPFRVGFSLLPDVDAAIVGTLHDVLEDCPQISMKDVEEAVTGNRRILDALTVLTHLTCETYQSYILGCAQNPLARKVKIADLKDNLDPARFERAVAAGQDAGKMNRLRMRYIEALQILEG